MARVLIVGRRSACYRAALRLGHSVFLWSSQTLHDSRKEHLAGWIEHDFEQCDNGIPDAVTEAASAFSPEFVIPATESSVMLAAMLREILGLEGITVSVADLAHNKFSMKSEAVLHDIPVTPFHHVTAADSADFLIDKLGLPLVLKPVDESGATDVRVARKKEEVERFLAPGLLAEAFVEGTEVSVETFVAGGVPIFHNITDYLHQWQKSAAPASLPAGLKAEILRINDKVIDAFNIERGLTHAEFYLAPDGPVFGEIAVRPPGGYYMELIERSYGFDPWETYVAIECGAKSLDLPATANVFTAVYMIHPGKGRVTSISGVKEVRRLAGVFEFKLDLSVGEDVPDHVNTSNEVGHVLIEAATQAELLGKISYIESTLLITVN